MFTHRMWVYKRTWSICERAKKGVLAMVRDWICSRKLCFMASMMFVWLRSVERGWTTECGFNSGFVECALALIGNMTMGT